jgi:hypothetical protein
VSPGRERGTGSGRSEITSRASPGRQEIGPRWGNKRGPRGLGLFADESYRPHAQPNTKARGQSAGAPWVAPEDAGRCAGRSADAR